MENIKMTRRVLIVMILFLGKISVVLMVSKCVC